MVWKAGNAVTFWVVVHTTEQSIRFSGWKTDVGGLGKDESSMKMY